MVAWFSVYTVGKETEFFPMCVRRRPGLSTRAPFLDTFRLSIDTTALGSRAAFEDIVDQINRIADIAAGMGRKISVIAVPLMARPRVRFAH